MTNAQLLTIPQFAREIGVSKYVARVMIANRQVETVEIGRRLRIHSETVRSILDRGTKTVFVPRTD